MKKIFLTFIAIGLLFFTALMIPAITHAQTVDDTGEFDEAITGTALVYTAVRVNDVNENEATDVVFTLSESEITAWADYSAAVRFTASQIDVRNAEEFAEPENVIPVDFNTLYHIWIAVDAPAKTYTVWAKTNVMSNPVLIFRDAAFRNDAISSITRWSALHNPDTEPDQLQVETVAEVPQNYAISLPGGADGSLSNITIPSLNLSSLPLTVEMWYKPDPTQNDYATLWYNRGASNNAGFQYDRWDDQTKVKAVWNGDSELPDHAPDPDEWNHMALVITATNKTFYVNGEPTTESGETFDIYEFDGVTYLGWDDAGAERTLNGLIDEVRIWSTARTAQELEGNQSEPLNGDEAGLIGYWNFDDMAEEASDITANENDGTINGGVYMPSFAATGIAESPDATLSALEVDAGVLQPEFHPEVESYKVHFPEGTSSITVTATANDDGANATGDGSVDVSSGSAMATITVTAEDGVTEMTYTIEFILTSNYAMYLPGGNGENSHIELPAIDLTTLPVTIELLMKPEGAQPDYAGLFFNTAANAGGLLFVGWQQNGGVGGEMGGQANPEDEFSIRTFSSEDAVVDEWNHVAVVLTETSRTLYLNGTPYLEEFTATAPDFTQGTTYIGWHDSETGRVFKGLMDEVRVWNSARNLEEIRNNKFATLEGDETGLLGYWNFNDLGSEATDLTANAYHGTITGGTYAPSFDVSDATLTEITLDVGDLNEEFDPEVTSYTATVPASATSVVVSATPAEYHASLTGTGEVDVSSGSGTATIVVTALDGVSTETYTVEITPEGLPEGATLSGLTVDAGELDPEFHPGITSYLVVPPAGTATVLLTATSEDEEADVEGDGEIDVSSGSAIAEVVVTSSDGERSMTYTVEILVGSPYGPLELNHSYTFEDGTANDVAGDAHGTIEGGTVSYGSYVSSEEGDIISLPAEQIEINSYRAVTFEAFVTAGNEANGGMTMLAYFGGSPEGVGANGFFMTIARGDDKSRTAISCGNETSPWSVEEGADGPELEDGRRRHLISVLTDDSIVWYIDGVRQNAAVLSEHNKIANLSNEFAWLCRGGYANDPTWLGSIHEFNIYTGVMDASEIAERSEMYLGESDATLAGIELDAGELTPDFDPLLTSYTVAVPAGTTTVTITATPNYGEAEVIGDGEIDVSSGSATATIVVNAKDGINTKTYSVEITVNSAANDATLADLTADVGEWQPEFDPSETSYSLKVPEGTTSVTITATPNDESAEVEGDGVIDLSSGSATVDIEVTAVDGTTTMTYTVDVAEDFTTGVNDETARLFEVYPTVSSDRFTIRFSGAPGKITVFDLYGNLILRKSAASTEETIDISSSGVFIVGLESNGVAGRFKVIKIN